MGTSRYRYEERFLGIDLIGSDIARAGRFFSKGRRISCLIIILKDGNFDQIGTFAAGLCSDPNGIDFRIVRVQGVWALIIEEINEPIRDEISSLLILFRCAIGACSGTDIYWRNTRSDSLFWILTHAGDLRLVRLGGLQCLNIHNEIQIPTALGISYANSDRL